MFIIISILLIIRWKDFIWNHCSLCWWLYLDKYEHCQLITIQLTSDKSELMARAFDDDREPKSYALLKILSCFYYLFFCLSVRISTGKSYIKHRCWYVHMHFSHSFHFERQKHSKYSTVFWWIALYIYIFVLARNPLYSDKQSSDASLFHNITHKSNSTKVTLNPR